MDYYVTEKDREVIVTIEKRGYGKQRCLDGITNRTLHNMTERARIHIDALIHYMESKNMKVPYQLEEASEWLTDYGYALNREYENHEKSS